MQNIAAYILSAIAGLGLGFLVYNIGGDRYFHFERGNIRQAKFDHLTGELKYFNPTRAIRVRYDAKGHLWSGLTPTDEVLVRSDTGEAVVVVANGGPQLVVNGRHRFTKKRDPIPPHADCWVSAVDPSLIVRPQEGRYSWEKVSVQASLKYGPEEDGWVFIEAP